MGKQLAVVNVARLRHPLTDRRMAAFVDGIDSINRLAEASPGFVWRRTGVAGHSALLAGSDGDLIVNVSIWQTYLDFHTFTYHGAHGRYFTAREQWFAPIPGPTTALWWISEDDRPNVDHALAGCGRFGEKGRANVPSPSCGNGTRRGTPYDGLVARTVGAADTDYLLVPTWSA